MIGNRPRSLRPEPPRDEPEYLVLRSFLRGRLVFVIGCSHSFMCNPTALLTTAFTRSLMANSLKGLNRRPGAVREFSRTRSRPAPPWNWQEGCSETIAHETRILLIRCS